MIIQRGDIYYADLRPVVGSEQGGIRPVLIVQNDAMQGHKHNDSGHRHQLPEYGCQSSCARNGITNGSGERQDTGIGYANIGLPTKYNDNYGQPRLSFETRAKNMTVRLWKRIN